MKINSFADAKRKLNEINSAVAEIKQFLDMADNAISAVDMLKGGSRSPGASQNGNVPASWSERVISLFKQSDKPLMQKSAADMYKQLGWPGSDSKELYGTISGAIAYLHKKKGILEKTEEGYRLKK